MFFRVADKVRRQVAAVELHTFDDIQFVFQRFAVFNGNHAFFADFHHLRAHVFEFVFQFDFFGDGNAVFGDVRAAEGAVKHHVAAFRAQGYADGVCQSVHAVYHFLADFVTELYVFCCHVLILQNCLILSEAV